MYPTPNAARAAEIYGASAGESPLSLLVQAHDGMIAKLQEAKAAVADGRIEDRFNSTSKVHKVIDVLQMALDRERGGEIAASLEHLYAYFGRRLVELNFKNDPVICDELIDRLGELRDGWRTLLQGGPAMPAVPLDLTSLSA